MHLRSLSIILVKPDIKHTKFALFEFIVCNIFWIYTKIRNICRKLEKKDNLKRIKYINKPLLMLLFIGSSAFAYAQEENSISRIDSLTKVLYGFSEKICAQSITQFNPNMIEAQEYEQEMKKLGSSIEYKYNAYVQRQLNHMSYSNCKYLKSVSQRAQTYFKIYEPIIDKHGLPNELKYLSVIESGLNTNAISRAGASGLWQFMPGTGKVMQMEVGKIVDERYHITVATEKACEYLKRMYESFGNWSLALAAYNAGPGNVRKAIKRSGGSRDFWKVQRYLPGETKNYVPRFMATVYLMENIVPGLMDDCASDNKMLVSVDVNSKVHLKHISAYLGVSVDSLLKFNPMYRQKVIDNELGKRNLFLPYDLAMVFMQLEDQIYHLAQTSISNNIQTKLITKIVYHKVKAGEKMASIALKYGCSSYEIKKWNRLKSYRVYTGRKLKIREKVAVCSADHVEDGVYFYVVEKGESIESICRKIPNLDKQYVLIQNFIDSETEELREGRIIEVHYGKVYAEE